jgi:hydrogenase nickel incorporation protein HypA/HybF
MLMGSSPTPPAPAVPSAPAQSRGSPEGDIAADAVAHQGGEVHEPEIFASIVDAVALRAGDRSVTRVRVLLGALHEVQPEVFVGSFEAAAAGTVAEGAKAELVVLPVRFRCEACGDDGRAHERLSACPSCDGAELHLTGGDELVLELLEFGP